MKSWLKETWPMCEQSFAIKAKSRHLIEPRFDEFKSAAEKGVALGDISHLLSLSPFREALGSTKVISAGGFGPDNYQEGLSTGAYDLVAFGRLFV